MTDSNALLLASILRGLEQMEMEKSEFLRDWNARKERLRHSAQKLKDDILSGQSGLFAQGENGNGEKKAGVEVPPELGLEKSAEQT